MIALPWPAPRRAPPPPPPHQGTTASAAATGIADSPVHLTLLKPDATKALAVGTLPNTAARPRWAKPEQLYACASLGDRAYLGHLPPDRSLYVLDFDDPTDPVWPGSWKSAGIPTTCLPLSERYLLGIGKDALSDGSKRAMAGLRGTRAWWADRRGRPGQAAGSGPRDDYRHWHRCLKQATSRRGAAARGYHLPGGRCDSFRHGVARGPARQLRMNRSLWGRGSLAYYGFSRTSSAAWR